MNYSQFTLDHLLERVRVIDDMMPDLTQRGLEKAQDELSAIEAELDERQPEREFVTLLGDDNQPVGFEPKIETGMRWVTMDEATIEKRNNATRYPITTPPPNNLGDL